MHEYITKDAALAALERASIVGSLNAARDNIMAIAAIDAVPVVHGRWLCAEYDGYADGAPVYDTWSCSACGEEYVSEGRPPDFKFCPSCGALMTDNPR